MAMKNVMWIFVLAAAISLINFVEAVPSVSKSIGPVPTQNSTCHKQIDCSSSHYETYLTCNLGRCMCPSHTHYDSFDGICKIKSLSRCIIKRQQTDIVQPCVRFASCSYPIKDGKEGICQCIEKSSHPDGTCGAGNLLGSMSILILLSCFLLNIHFS